MMGDRRRRDTLVDIIMTARRRARDVTAALYLGRPQPGFRTSRSHSRDALGTSTPLIFPRDVHRSSETAGQHSLWPGFDHMVDRVVIHNTKFL